ncbi:MAG: Crp/Fnr family transcriptional regulator [Acutalibacteraceae bacterium]
MKKYFEILQDCPLFNGIKGESLEKMLGCLGARQKSYKKGDTVFAEGERARYIGIVLKGNVQLVRVDYYGNRSILASVEPTELFGEAFACAGVDSLPIDVIAAEESEILLIDARYIVAPCKNACQFHSRLIVNLLNTVARKNIVLHQKIEITTKHSTREKLMAYLLLQAKKAESASFTIPYNRQELADYLGVERSGLSTEIGRLRNERVLECKRNAFRLL